MLVLCKFKGAHEKIMSINECELVVVIDLRDSGEFWMIGYDLMTPL